MYESKNFRPAPGLESLTLGIQGPRSIPSSTGDSPHFDIKGIRKNSPSSTELGFVSKETQRFSRERNFKGSAANRLIKNLKGSAAKKVQRFSR